MMKVLVLALSCACVHSCCCEDGCLNLCVAYLCGDGDCPYANQHMDSCSGGCFGASVSCSNNPTPAPFSDTRRRAPFGDSRRRAPWPDDDAACSLYSSDTAARCYDSCAGGKPLPAGMLSKCGQAAFSASGRAGGQGPGCPITGIFDIDGMCCLSCAAGCNADAAPSAAMAYVLSFLAFLVVVLGSIWAFGRVAIEALVNDAGMMQQYAVHLVQNAPKELKGMQKAFHEEQLDDDKEMVADCTNVKKQLKGAVQDGSFLTNPGAAANGCLNSAIKKITGDASTIENQLLTLPETSAEAFGANLRKVGDKLVAKAETTKAWALFHISRFVLAEVLILGALVTPPPCLSGIEQACKDGALCCGPITLYHIKKVVGILGVVINLGIPICLTYSMRQQGGRQAYFPGALSNNLFQIVTNRKMCKVVNTAPYADVISRNGKIGFCYKFALGMCGYAIWLGVMLECLSDLKAFMSAACSNDLGAAASAMKAAFAAIVFKLPELVMYLMLFVVYTVEFAIIIARVCFSFLESFLEEDDGSDDDSVEASAPRSKSGCCSGKCATHEKADNSFGSDIESDIYHFYSWFFFAIDDLGRGWLFVEPRLFICFGPKFTSLFQSVWADCPNIALPYSPNLDAFKKDYDRYKFQEWAKHARTANNYAPPQAQGINRS